MENDKKTVPTYVNIILDDSPEFLDLLREQAEEDSQNEEGIKKLSLTIDKHKISTDETYFEEGKIHIAFNLTSKKGDAYVCIELPLSQEVLFNILGESIKKFNKVKTIMEATQ
jgi:hypothetical protein